MAAAASSRLVYLLLVASVWSHTLPIANTQMEEDLHFEDLPAQSEVVSVSARVPGALDGYFILPHSLIDGVLPGSIPYGRHMKSSNKVRKVCLPNIIEVRVWNISTTASCSLQTYQDANKYTQTLWLSGHITLFTA